MEKRDYYYTDYVDKDYPTKLTAREEILATDEEEEALRIQKRLLSTLEDVDLHLAYEDEAAQEDLMDFIERQNKSIDAAVIDKNNHNDDEKLDSEEEDEEEEEDEDEVANSRRPINLAIKKNRGLTPYKKKEYRNPRVKHKLKYKKAMSKRRRNVREARPELHRYSGETTGIKTSTIKSVKLC